MMQTMRRVSARGSQGPRTQMRSYIGLHVNPMGDPHPDIQYGGSPMYRGRGWVSFQKQMPQDALSMHGGSTMMQTNNRHGHVKDPEDARHGLARAQQGEVQGGFDGAVHVLAAAEFGVIPKSSRLMQLLYNHYCEPISMNRITVPLMHYSKVPNNSNDFLCTIEYLGQTAQLIGNAFVAMGTVVMEGTTIRGDANQVYVLEGCQIMENVCMIADAPTTLHNYQRQELFNPYQTLEVTEGVVRLNNNVMVEPNCLIEACSIGAFTRIGHNTKILKGCKIAHMCLIMPGSVVLANTHMNEGEIWGGAPAVKLGKLSKWEWKRPWFPSVNHREAAIEIRSESSRYGDQLAFWCEEMQKLDWLMVQYEKGLPAGVKAKIREYIEGPEPVEHTIARITQGWSPGVRPDDKMYDSLVPSISMNFFANHNEQSVSEYSGTMFNWKNYFTSEKRW